MDIKVLLEPDSHLAVHLAYVFDDWVMGIVDSGLRTRFGI